MEWLADLESTCAALGTTDGVNYHKDPECLECIKDLIRFLRRDDSTHLIRRSLGKIGVVQSDLIPLLREYTQEQELFDLVLRILVNLTGPELLLFREELPAEKVARNYYIELQTHRQAYKKVLKIKCTDDYESTYYSLNRDCFICFCLVLGYILFIYLFLLQAFVDEKLWAILTQQLGQLLRKEFNERSEDDGLVIERILILVRNILQVPKDTLGDRRTDDEASIHDQVSNLLNKIGVKLNQLNISI